jgi:hypothetical protein
LYAIEGLICTLRNVLRIFLYFESSKWDRVTALVTGCAIDEHFWYAAARLHYKFDYLGSAVKASDVCTFIGKYSAQDWAATFPHNFPVTIRVNPKNTQQTRFFEADQKGAVQEFEKRVLKAVIGAIVVVAVIVFAAWARRKLS